MNCPIPRCETALQPYEMLCVKHWLMLSANMKYEMCRAKASKDAKPLHWRSVFNLAVNVVNQKEGYGQQQLEGI